MHPLLRSLRGSLQFSGAVAEDVVLFLRHHGLPQTAAHSAAVSAEARRLAIRFGADPEAAAVAGWLHDSSAPIPNHERIAAAETLGVPVLPEERLFPMIVHQKLSLVIARDLFGVADDAILSAIGCHTTLRAAPAQLDTLLFVADKISWDQPGSPPYLNDIQTALARSLDEAALCYINYLWARRAELRVIHPWLAAARASLSGT